MLALSSGDPAGIGPEVTIKALAEAEVAGLAEIIVCGDPELIRRTAAGLGLPVPARLEPAGSGEAVTPGQISAEAGEAALQAVARAVELVRAGVAQALVTAPLSKEALRLAGHPWPGHTELLADLTGTQEVRMMLVAGWLRVVHVTTHRSLRAAIEAVNGVQVLRTLQMAQDGGRLFGLSRPRLGVAGLNPHAGEGGLFGDEEIRHIAPAIETARSQGIEASGPHPADTLFWRASQGDFDMVVAMYHDQGHIPVKLAGIDEGVNVTLGLPFPRTSVDHGTAFDIAGQGRARHQSLVAAIRLAATIASGTPG